MVRNDPYVGLANRWFQPLTHLSSSTRRRFRSGLQIYEEKVFLQGFKQFLLEYVAGDDAVEAELGGDGVLDGGLLAGSKKEG